MTIADIKKYAHNLSAEYPVKKPQDTLLEFRYFKRLQLLKAKVQAAISSNQACKLSYRQI